MGGANQGPIRGKRWPATPPLNEPSRAPSSGGEERTTARPAGRNNGELPVREKLGVAKMSAPGLYSELPGDPVGAQGHWDTDRERQAGRPKKN